MSTIDYSSFETPTGSWSGSSAAPPNYLKDYKIIASSITDLYEPNSIITFAFGAGEENASGKLKVVSGNMLNLPFDKAYVDISDYDDYIVIKNNNPGQYSGIWVSDQSTISPASFTVAYTEGGFWVMGAAQNESPNVIFRAYPTGIGDYSYDSIITLPWLSINEGSIGELRVPNFTDLNDDPSGEHNFIYQLNFVENGPTPPIQEILIRFDDNGQSWTRRRINIGDLRDTTGVIVSGLDLNSGEQIITFALGVDLGSNSAIEFYWSNGVLYKEAFPSLDGLPAPYPFDSSFFNSQFYGTANVYADEPMISYEVINNHSIRVTTTAEEVASLIPPLRKLYVNFSGIIA
jgi:hypothetical protein